MLLCLAAVLSEPLTTFSSDAAGARLRRTILLTGFNTDVAHDGITYHVQTEDKGLDAPIILSLVYVGGAILASKRTPYDDLIATGFDEKSLAERIQRQHKLICAAIRAGRIEDLKRMGPREASVSSAPAMEQSAELKTKEKKPSSEPAPAQKPAPPREQAKSAPRQQPAAAATPKAPAPLVPKGAPPETSAPKTSAPAREKKAPAPPTLGLPKVRAVASGIADFARQEAAADALHLVLLDDEGDFRAGELVMIKIYVGRGAGGSEAIPNAPVSIKILGTAFRPQIFSLVTDERGIAVARTELPLFVSGRAAIMIRATADGYEAELRRIIRPAKG